MKTIVIVAALATLAACSKPDAAPAPDATEQAAATTAPAVQTVAADGKSSVGTFKVTSADGQVSTEEDKPDGTYVSTRDGKIAETGKWEQKSAGEFCYTKDEPNPKQLCNTEKVDAKGIWTSVNAAGKTSTVVRVGG